ncbi:hypothetical protein ID866_8174, partial [Astraeus odoratus]
MSDFHLVDPRGWEYDLQSVHAAYMGYFQLHSVPWYVCPVGSLADVFQSHPYTRARFRMLARTRYDRSWGHLFETFEQFLTFSWPVITVTDAHTGRAHIVTRMTSIGAFLKMIRTRFGETLPQIDNMLKVTPFETAQRHLRNVNDWNTYRKLHATLPAVALAAFRARVRGGDPEAIRTLWSSRDKTFLAMAFTWSERNSQSCLEWGYATVRCGHLDALGAWPPVPETNYRSKGHYIIAEYADKVVNKLSPTHPWKYAFGESQVVPRAKLARIIQSVLSSLASPDSETSANSLVIVGNGVYADIHRLEEMKIKLPHNVLSIDIATLERAISGRAPPSSSAKNASTARLNIVAFLHSLGIPYPCVLSNAGNDAFMALYAFQRMVDPESMRGVAAPGGASIHMTVPSMVPSPRMSGVFPQPVPASSSHNNLQAHPSIRTKNARGSLPHTHAAVDGNSMTKASADNIAARALSSLMAPISPLLLPAADGMQSIRKGSTTGKIRDQRNGSAWDRCISPMNGTTSVDELGRQSSFKGNGRRERGSA